ncbi:hypothetical protein BC835DRAFT_1308350 [Cytidiella melzeri]|nr:hypothetical protein BC835DRAFT_1308350 [Cytidiella melzeri]
MYNHQHNANLRGIWYIAVTHMFYNWTEYKKWRMTYGRRTKHNLTLRHLTMKTQPMKRMTTKTQLMKRMTTRFKMHRAVALFPESEEPAEHNSSCARLAETTGKGKGKATDQQQHAEPSATNNELNEPAQSMTAHDTEYIRHMIDSRGSGLWKDSSLASTAGGSHQESCTAGTSLQQPPSYPDMISKLLQKRPSSSQKQKAEQLQVGFGPSKRTEATSKVTVGEPVVQNGNGELVVGPQNIGLRDEALKAVSAQQGAIDVDGEPASAIMAADVPPAINLNMPAGGMPQNGQQAEDVQDKLCHAVLKCIDDGQRTTGYTCMSNILIKALAPINPSKFYKHLQKRKSDSINSFMRFWLDVAVCEIKKSSTSNLVVQCCREFHQICQPEKAVEQASNTALFKSNRKWLRENGFKSQW